MNSMSAAKLNKIFNDGLDWMTSFELGFYLIFYSVATTPLLELLLSMEANKCWKTRDAPYFGCVAP
jgi:hypothetical protein